MLPLTDGDHGEAVRDLQRRLVAAGFDPGESGVLGAATVNAIRRFQAARGLVTDGRCDRQTWSALVESGYRLGDRLLYLRQPMLRGDDVTELQRRLGSLGFDAGRVDGILGPDTEGALRDFQRNAGLTIDGVCGRDTLQALDRLGGRIDDAVAVAGVREQERLRVAPRDLAGRRVVVAQSGGLDSFANALRRHLADDGARVVVLDHLDGSEQAARANEFGAELLIALDLGDAPCWTAYYGTTGFESAGGRRLAHVVVDELRAVALATDDPRRMRLPALRETRMPAIIAHLGPADEVVPGAARIAGSLAGAVARWARSPL